MPVRHARGSPVDQFDWWIPNLPKTHQSLVSAALLSWKFHAPGRTLPTLILDLLEAQLIRELGLELVTVASRFVEQNQPRLFVQRFITSVSGFFLRHEHCLLFTTTPFQVLNK